MVCYANRATENSANMKDFTAMAARAQHTYLYCQTLLEAVRQQAGDQAPAIRRLAQEAELAAMRWYVKHALNFVDGLISLLCARPGLS